MKKNQLIASTSPATETIPPSANAAATSESGNGTINSEQAGPSESRPETINSLKSSLSARRFIGLVEAGIEMWIKAGEMFYEWVLEDGTKAFEGVEANCPWMNRSMLWNFYKIGEHKLYPKVLIFSANQFIVRDVALLSWEDQIKVCNTGLPLLTIDERGKEKLIPKPLPSLERKDIYQGIDGNKLRGVESQRPILLATERSNTNLNITSKGEVVAGRAKMVEIRMDAEGKLSLKEVNHDSQFAVKVHFFLDRNHIGEKWASLALYG